MMGNQCKRRKGEEIRVGTEDDGGDDCPSDGEDGSWDLGDLAVDEAHDGDAGDLNFQPGIGNGVYRDMPFFVTLQVVRGFIPRYDF